jgi:hypothetical protein
MPAIYFQRMSRDQAHDLICRDVLGLRLAAGSSINSSWDLAQGHARRLALALLFDPERRAAIIYNRRRR